MCYGYQVLQENSPKSTVQWLLVIELIVLNQLLELHNLTVIKKMYGYINFCRFIIVTHMQNSWKSVTHMFKNRLRLFTFSHKIKINKLFTFLHIFLQVLVGAWPMWRSFLVLDSSAEFLLLKWILYLTNFTKPNLIRQTSWFVCGKECTVPLKQKSKNFQLPLSICRLIHPYQYHRTSLLQKHAHTI